jgi:uncharacterized protein YndB with AHSA1/START domain
VLGQDSSPVLLLATPCVAGARAVEAIATAQVAAAPEQVFRLLTDFSAWERVFSGIRVLRRTARRGERTRATSHASSVVPSPAR